MYGIQCFDADGALADLNFNSVLVVEGVFSTGNYASGIVQIDALFPLRGQFKGIFMMPLMHSFTGAPIGEYTCPVYLSGGFLMWDWPASLHHHGHETFAGGAFLGRQFIYGYFN